MPLFPPPLTTTFNLTSHPPHPVTSLTGDALDSEGIRGVVGGEVTFTCISRPEMHLSYLYFNKITSQKPQFVNGYHQTEKMTPHIEMQFSERTHVNDSQRTMTMLNVTPIDEGVYQCLIGYIESHDMDDMHMNLTVTGGYSDSLGR